VVDDPFKKTPASTTLSSTRNGISASQRVFVPVGATHEVWTLTVKNRTRRKRTISVFAHVEFDIRGFPAPWLYTGHPNHLTRFDKNLGGIWAQNLNVYRPHDRYGGFLIASRKVSRFDCDRTNLYGPLGTFFTPGIGEGWNGTNVDCDSGYTCATLQHRLTLKPGQEVRIDYALGEAGKRREILRVRHSISKKKTLPRQPAGG